MGAGPARRPEGKGTTREPARRRHGHTAGHRTRPVGRHRRRPGHARGRGPRVRRPLAGPAGQRHPPALGDAPGARPHRPPDHRPALGRGQAGARAAGRGAPRAPPVGRHGHAAARLRHRRALARRPDAQERRPVHHAPARRRHHPRRARHGHHDAGRGAAARHRRGHRLLAREARRRLRRRGRAPRRRRHQARQGPARRRGRGRDDPQDGRGDGARPARARHQARRPAAQHAHDALPQAGEAGQEGPRDPRGARAAGPPAGDVDGQVGARGPRVRDPAPQALRRDRPPRRRPRAQPRHLPALGDRRGLRAAHRGPGEGRGARAAEALLLDLPEDDRQG